MGLKIESRSKEWLREHRHHVVCPCGRAMVLRNAPFGIVYFCSECRVFHGAHQRTGKPFGTPASDKETRLARMDAHKALDRLWKSGKMDRSQAYAWLASKMGLSMEECHIGRFDLDRCRWAVEICEGFEA